jgi:hypothetical protein
MAYEIINRLEIEKNTELLNHLESLLTARQCFFQPVRTFYYFLIW